MKNKYDIIMICSAVALFVLVFILGLNIGLHIPIIPDKTVRKLQAECEKDLPRNKHCVPKVAFDIK